jgi:hypothetical protein
MYEPFRAPYPSESAQQREPLYLPGFLQGRRRDVEALPAPSGRKADAIARREVRAAHSAPDRFVVLQAPRRARDSHRLAVHGRAARKDAPEYYMGYPETIGQCTGLRDKNGKLIFEGNICTDEYKMVVEIVWANTYLWACKIIKTANPITLAEGIVFPIWQWDKYPLMGNRQLEVIGNIHDNPELLEVGDD